ncbi:MAG: prepilin-type N-terminal cleavage/methylation domain-containing protein [Nitrospirae bacterium]|nr:prepilin-type N-terminal cleavage/methylation domain-containing protein [Nitrospirota bacterium]
MTRRWKKGPAKGFTLVEVLIAVTVLSISFFALLPLITSAVSTDKTALLTTKSQAVTAYKMDELLAAGTSMTCNGAAYVCGAAPGNTCIDFVNAETDVVSAATAGAPFEIMRTSNALIVNATSGLCKLTITSTYTYQGEVKTFRLITEKSL